MKRCIKATTDLDFEEINDLIVSVCEELNIQSDPQGYGSTSVDYFYDVDSGKQLGKIKSTELENQARKCMSSPKGRDEFKRWLKKLLNM